jgi:hypothetical protein
MPESTQIDALIAKLRESSQCGYELLIEHLETAHAYLLGAMPKECAHNLQLAQELSASLPATPVRAEAEATVAGLLHDLQSPVHEADSSPSSHPATKNLTDFFQGGGVNFGIFYPRKHVVAVFPSLASARAGHLALSNAGFRLWEAVVVPGEEMERFLGDLRAHRHLWAGLMTELSRLLDTEAGLVDRYARWARKGSGFLVAYSPTEADADRIATLLQPFEPRAMHWFTASSIYHLV